MDRSGRGVQVFERRLRLRDASLEPDTSATLDDVLDHDLLFVEADGNRRGKRGVVLGH
jgi:hypothetical protein